MNFRYALYIKEFLSKWLRHKLKRAGHASDEIDKKSHTELVVDAAEKGDPEAACAAFLDLWQTLKMGRQPDPVLLDYFEPKFVEIALYGMSLSLRDSKDEASLRSLDDIFKLKRPKTGKNERGAGQFSAKQFARNLEITLLVEEELRKIEESGEVLSHGKMTEAYLSVAEDLKESEDENMESETTSNDRRASQALGHESVQKIYLTHKGLLEQFVQDDLSDLQTRRREYSTLKKVFRSFQSTTG